MIIDELRKKCLEESNIVLKLPPPNGQGYTRRLCGKNGPRGVIISGTERGQLVRFKSDAVLRYLNYSKENKRCE